MGGPVMRGIAGLFSAGVSELTQKKPFQNIGKDEPAGTSAPWLRPWGWVGTGASSLITVNEQLSQPDAVVPEPDPVLGESQGRRQQRLDRVAREERRLRSGKGRASTIVAGRDDEEDEEPGAFRRFLGGR